MPRRRRPHSLSTELDPARGPECAPRGRHVARLGLVFTLRFAVAYALFAALWPLIHEPYADGYRAVANALFGSFGSRGVARFERLTNGPPHMDTRLHVSRRDVPGTGRSCQHSTKVTGYLLTAEAAALILATPLSWRRRLKALLAGLVLAHTVVIARLFIAVLRAFIGDHPSALFTPGPVCADLIERVFQVTCVWPSFTFTVPLIIWLLVAIRRADLERWQLVAPGHSPAPRPGSRYPSQRGESSDIATPSS